MHDDKSMVMKAKTVSRRGPIPLNSPMRIPVRLDH